MSSHSGHDHQIPEGNIACAVDQLVLELATLAEAQQQWARGLQAVESPKLVALAHEQAVDVLLRAGRAAEDRQSRGWYRGDPIAGLVDELAQAGYVLCRRADAQP